MPVLIKVGIPVFKILFKKGIFVQSALATFNASNFPYSNKSSNADVSNGVHIRSTSLSIVYSNNFVRSVNGRLYFVNKSIVY